ERPPETELVETADGSLRRADTGHFFVGQVFGPRRRAPSVVQEQPEATVGHQTQSTHEQHRKLLTGSSDRICMCLSQTSRRRHPAAEHAENVYRTPDNEV